jgi:hypothetical protein
MKPNFAIAMGSYLVFALIAGFALDGKFRLVVWIFLGGLAVKTWIARKAGW